MEKHEKFKEILVLASLLTKKGIEFEIEDWLDGYHLGYPVLWERECKISVIEHGFSYGNELDQLESMMKNGKILPFRTATQVLELIEELEKAKR